jgi:rare lipoprotein A
VSARLQRLVELLARAGLPAAVGVAVLLLSGCAAKQGLIVEPSKPEVVYDATPVAVLHGKASYYYGRWIGRLTANGETYRASDVTAAHKTLPFNTMVRVTNLKNGKSVIVRINNRGPYIKGRILDLSLVAAQTIDMTKSGVVPVKAEILRKIPVVTQPNRKLTEAEKRAAEKRARQAAENAGRQRPI